MELELKQCQKPGYEKYQDLFLVFEHDGETYRVLVRPVFWPQMSLLRKVAKQED